MTVAEADEGRSDREIALAALDRSGKALTAAQEAKKGLASAGAAGGISLGSAIAVAISYTAGNPLGWVVIKGLFGWLYVIYYVLRYAPKIF